MNNASQNTRLEFAMQMVIMDAMEKGHTNKDELIAYMASETFQNAVMGYMAQI